MIIGIGGQLGRFTKGNGETAAVDGREVLKQRVALFKSGLPAVVDYESHHAAAFQELQPLFDRRNAGGFVRKYVVVALGKPPEIERNAGYSAFLEYLVHLAVAL